MFTMFGLPKLAYASNSLITMETFAMLLPRSPTINRNLVVVALVVVVLVILASLVG